ncbi:MAG TPA: DUF2911 domain-containing protein [Gemmatimonadales bacterium]|jgi:hypothetical protein
MRRLISGTLLALALPSMACAQNQPPFSQPASLMQMMGFTRITVTWSRPIAHGRLLFGGLVKYGRVWTPGADTASAVEFDRAVMIDGHQLPAGRYSIWTIPDTSSWTLIFNKVGRTFHTNYPGESNDALRVQVKVEQGPHVESLRYDMPEADRYHVLLRIAWGETRVSLPIRAIEP